MGGLRIGKSVSQRWKLRLKLNSEKSRKRDSGGISMTRQPALKGGPTPLRGKPRERDSNHDADMCNDERGAWEHARSQYPRRRTVFTE